MDAAQERALAERGYVVLAGFAHRALTGAARRMMDEILGPAAAQVADERRQPGPWPRFPVREGDAPVITSGNYRHSIMHPIHHTLPARLLAELPYLEP